MKIVFFDGYCSLCNALVDWLIKTDKSGALKFASLQGETARQLLGENHDPVEVDTVIYLRNGDRFERSTAILQILSDIGGAWAVARIFFLVPNFARDLIYKLIAKNRYRIMKKRASCRMPTEAERSRLLP